MENELDRAIDMIRDKPSFAFQNVYSMSEASITLIILGILHYYGWDVFNPNEVEPQFNKRIKGRPDLALKHSMQIKGFIEIKNAKQNLNDHKKQIKYYLEDRTEVKLGVLTNAVSWIFYKRDPETSSLLEVAVVDVNKHHDDYIKQIFDQYLSKEKIVK
ncbi:hypothetical protein GCM10025860_22040 [Methanobacterium ferruginis]|nr:hypothetical protein GCM10025860_22040 [Methanobacterium ferruginis]